MPPAPMPDSSAQRGSYRVRSQVVSRSH
jgi:hypothetical protein